jgi:hypothetical protein
MDSYLSRSSSDPGEGKRHHFREKRTNSLQGCSEIKSAEDFINEARVKNIGPHTAPPAALRGSGRHRFCAEFQNYVLF